MTKDKIGFFEKQKVMQNLRIIESHRNRFWTSWSQELMLYLLLQGSGKITEFILPTNPTHQPTISLPTVKKGIAELKKLKYLNLALHFFFAYVIPALIWILISSKKTFQTHYNYPNAC